MVDADEETGLLPTARDAAGREDSPRCRGRVVVLGLVLVGALALAAAGRGAADSETHKVANLRGGRYDPRYYGETRQIRPLNGPPAPNYYHKGPRAPKYNQNSANSAGSIKYQSVTSFFAKIYLREYQKPLYQPWRWDGFIKR